MSEHVLVGLTTIAVLGIGAQWLAWRVRVPSILLLLVAGFLVGNLTDLIPQALFGDLLFPAVSLAVALILFEGGLSLSYREFREVGRTVTQLIATGVVITGGLAAVTAYLLLDISLEVAAVLGAILIVTGPTVVTPLLEHVRPAGRVGPILRWEGIAIDPVGAMVTVLVFEAIIAGTATAATTVALTGVARTIAVGAAIGAVGAWLISRLLHRFLIPDRLQNPVVLMLVVAAFTASEELQPEAGLFAAPLMGMLLANNRAVSVKHIAEFEENLRVLLLAALFIVLGARVEFDDVQRLGWESLVFLGVLILVIRPLAVAIGTIGSRLAWRERVFIAAVAPRGVVAAAVASLFAIRLTQSGRAFGDRLLSEAFFVIVGTVAIYGLAAAPLARLLGVASKEKRGVLIIGAYAWVRKIALALQRAGADVVLVDSNRDNVRAARMEGLRAQHADALSEAALDHIDTQDVGRMLAMTSNDDFNTVAASHYADPLGRSEVFRLSIEQRREGRRRPERLSGRVLFADDLTFSDLTMRFVAGAEVRSTRITDRFDLESFRRVYGEGARPLFSVSDRGNLVVFTAGEDPSPKPGHTLISVVDRKAPELDQVSQRRWWRRQLNKLRRAEARSPRSTTPDTAAAPR